MSSAALTARYQPVRRLERSRVHQVLGRTIALLMAALGLVAGIFLGPLFGVAAALGLCRGEKLLVPGPGAWVARQVLRSLRGRSWCLPAAILAGFLTGLVTGPVWFDFLGWNLGKFVGDALLYRLIETE
ncbi:MAG: hypothetical protein AB1758_35920 [Candidatus Eremiobacterota bacterium]